MIDNEFKIISRLGHGASSIVYRVEDECGNRYAAKCIGGEDKITYTTQMRLLMREHQTLCWLQEHPNIIRSLGMNTNGTAIIDGFKHHIAYDVLELAQNGMLAFYIKLTGALEEEIWRFFSLQMLSALDYVHSKKFAHLDLKLENILFDECFNIKLADFGSAVNLSEADGFTCLKRGTPKYMAPEVLELQQNEEYDAYKADMYSFGVVLFAMLTGEFPNSEIISNNLLTLETDWSSSPEFIERAKNQDLKYKWLSKEVKELLSNLLDPEPFARPTASEILQGPWFTESFSQNICEEVYCEMNCRKRSLSKNPLKSNKML